MCKAKKYTEQLLDIYNNIQNDFDSLMDELVNANLRQTDLLHIIENTNFNAADGYKLAKMIKENRTRRREVKNELEPLKQLKDNFINKNMQLLNQTHQDVVRKDNILKELTENKTYHPRVVVDNTKTDESKLIYKKTGEEIKIIRRINKDLYLCLRATGYKNYINKKDIINLNVANMA